MVSPIYVLSNISNSSVNQSFPFQKLYRFVFSKIYYAFNYSSLIMPPIYLQKNLDAQVYNSLDLLWEGYFISLTL